MYLLHPRIINKSQFNFIGIENIISLFRLPNHLNILFFFQQNNFHLLLHLIKLETNVISQIDNNY